METTKRLTLPPPGPRAEAARVAVAQAVKRHAASVKLGQRIAHYRRAKNITQKDFAPLVGLHRITLARLENGNGTMNMLLKHFLAMAEVLEISPGVLLKGVEVKK